MVNFADGPSFSDALTAIATLISAASLYVAVRAGWQVTRPQIVINLEFGADRKSVELIVGNYGNGVASDIEFLGYDDCIVMNEYLSFVMESFLKNGIPILVPGAKRSTIIAGGTGLKELENARTAIKVRYKEKGLLGHMHMVQEEFTLDYVSFSGSFYQKSDAYLLRKAADKISKSLGAAAGSLASINAKMRG